MNIDLLRAIKKNPLMFLARKSLNCYFTFWQGYYWATKDLDVVVSPETEITVYPEHALIRARYGLPDLVHFHPTNLMDLVSESDEDALERYLELEEEIIRDDTNLRAVESVPVQRPLEECSHLRIQMMQRVKESLKTFSQNMKLEELRSLVDGYDYAIKAAGVKSADENLFPDFSTWLSDYHGLPHNLRWERIIHFCNILGPLPPRTMENCFEQFDAFLKERGEKYGFPKR
jgi:hypothetical protein